ncbi:MAG: coproporphyrinogen dehydrogenase HemZ [Lachnospiraceae bacterium]|nr:coproporphyrinogen dehydrogenase HemZ [Lachnospiraceae bacterium]
MINAYVNRENLEYDIYALLKAFYPGDEVSINVVNDGEAVEESGRVPSFYDVKVCTDKVSCSYYDPDDGRGTEGPDDGPLGKAVYFDSEEIMAPGRAVLKDAMKRCIYRCASIVSGRTLPWGILTGIRPVKLAMTRINEGDSDEQTGKLLKYRYLMSDEKASLSIEIAHKERDILKKIDRYGGYSLYIGIPFCPTTCLYCSFTSYPIARYASLVDDYISGLKKELDLTYEIFKGRSPDSVYIGGGTPTTLAPDKLKQLIGYLGKLFDFDKVLELTVEAGRPDSIDKEKLMTLKELGVSRISINPQTMNEKTLRLIGRRHTVGEFKNAFALARECGFDNINTDIILGLPGEGLDEVRNTMEELKTLDPESITVHSMAIKRAAGMAEYLKEHEEIKSINTPEMLKCTDSTARALGMSPYYLYRQKNMAGNFENVGYAKEGCEGIYNILIMEELQSIIACGAGTVSKRVYTDGLIERCDNVKDVELYLSRLDEMLERKKKLFCNFSDT